MNALLGDTREATTSAGSITTRLLGNFQDIEHVFIVGVGGGVAHYTDAEKHVRLGDVVVSLPDPDAYVFSHTYTIDRETENVNGFVVRKWNPHDRVITEIAKTMYVITFRMSFCVLSSYSFFSLLSVTLLFFLMLYDFGGKLVYFLSSNSTLLTFFVKRNLRRI